MRIAILDYGLGNLRSVTQALVRLQVEAQLTTRAEDVEHAGALILPGVGAFGDGMAGLRERGLVEPLRAAVRAGKPLLGICLGLQLFFESSEESPGVEGLGLLPGVVARFSGAAFGAKSGLKVPHMGWNALSLARPHPVLAGTADGAYVYFVHSYYVRPATAGDVLALSDYGGRFCAVAGRGAMVGCQFHPEKSQAVGLRILRDFAAWAARAS